MKLEPVESSNIKGVGYDPSTRALRVQFSSGQVHQYEDVPPETHAAFMASESKGKHFHANIKSAFKSSKVEPDATLPGA